MNRSGHDDFHSNFVKLIFVCYGSTSSCLLAPICRVEYEQFQSFIDRKREIWTCLLLTKVVEEAKDVPDEMEDSVRLGAGRGIGVAIAPHVWGHHMVALISEAPHLMSPRVPRLRKPVEKYHQGGPLVPELCNMDPYPVGLDPLVIHLVLEHVHFPHSGSVELDSEKRGFLRVKWKERKIIRWWWEVKRWLL